MKRGFKYPLLLIWVISISACFPFILGVGDRALTIQATIQEESTLRECWIYLYDKDGDELIKWPVRLKNNNIDDSFTVAPYDREYFIRIECPQGEYKSEVFLTSEPHTVINLGAIRLND